MTVRVGWHPAKPSNYNHGRGGRAPVAEVNHRMVGWLLGTRRYFTVSSERPVSTHFGIGHVARDSSGALRPLCPECGAVTGARGPIGIDQYVDLADTAFANGNADPSGGWPLLRVGVNPNTTTYSIEHEDGGTAGGGVVTAHVRRTSVALTRLLHTASLAELRAAGIHIGQGPHHDASEGPAIARALHAIPVGAEHFIDHHRIAGRLKPSCWQPWLHDRGYAGGGTQAAKLAALRPASPAPVPGPWPPPNLGKPPPGAAGWVKVHGSAWLYTVAGGHVTDRQRVNPADFSAYVERAASIPWPGHGSRRLARIVSGVWHRHYVAIDQGPVTYHPRSV